MEDVAPQYSWETGISIQRLQCALNPGAWGAGVWELARFAPWHFSAGAACCQSREAAKGSSPARIRAGFVVQFNI
jgi:hypothetical protein